MYFLVNWTPRKRCHTPTIKDSIKHDLHVHRVLLVSTKQDSIECGRCYKKSYKTRHLTFPSVVQNIPFFSFLEENNCIHVICDVCFHLIKLRQVSLSWVYIIMCSSKFSRCSLYISDNVNILMSYHNMTLNDDNYSYLFTCILWYITMYSLVNLRCIYM